MAKKTTMETEAFIRAWLQQRDAKTWDEFYAGMKAKFEESKLKVPTENAVNLRCQKINKSVKKATKKTYPVPAKPKAAKNIAELLKMNPDLMPS
jgi:hypothetical protein